MGRMGSVLAVDANKDVVYALKSLLEVHVKRFDSVNSPCQVTKFLKSHEYDVVILALDIETESKQKDAGFKVLHHILKHNENANVLFYTPHGRIEDTVNAIKSGAKDVIKTPWENERLVQKVLSYLKKEESPPIKKKPSNGDIKFIYRSPCMQEIVRTINKVAPSDANVLVLGENGTGKELVADALHKVSSRKKNLLLSVDMGSLSESLFENELFGHSKGAYTDAKAACPGRFEMAHGGTVFLDEIGNLNLSCQSKLLTVIEKREITRIGESKPRPIDVRLVCATNKSIYQMVKDDEFRQDLLYRINTVEIVLPPLRERKEDIPLLVSHFITLYCSHYRKPPMKVDKSALRCMMDYAWPGNVRELQHAVEKGVIMADNNLLSKKDLCHHNGDSYGDDVYFDTYNLEEIERHVINKVLQTQEGNLTHSAEALGITRTALYRRIRKYGL
ncbi:sigma-54-dependent transcriptional regulator [Carboxylicivirga sp. N1Y90]|uniref:sigma-54-dependent transcriptional regulator n=1 Tax=Carboxylicivirga fragile TaxID=3417571 RepID=UPI003D331BE5|nr:sigma-54-dependent Fis family transcriptional regulator [Marinilabiliaceae bacterium N1Y90]